MVTGSRIRLGRWDEYQFDFTVLSCSWSELVGRAALILVFAICAFLTASCSLADSRRVQPITDATVVAVEGTGDQTTPSKLPEVFTESTYEAEAPRSFQEPVEVTPPGPYGKVPSRSASAYLDPEARLADTAEKLGQSEHFLFYRIQSSLAPPPSELQREAEMIYNYLTGRLQKTGPQQIEVLFVPPDRSPCPARGMTGSVPMGPSQGSVAARILVYAGVSTSREQIYGVLAHETAHTFTMQGELASGDRALAEGLASWAAGDYQTAWYGVASYDEKVAIARADGRYRPLSVTDAITEVSPHGGIGGEACLERRDILYAQWASFIDFLTKQYGWLKFQNLLESTWTALEDDVRFGQAPDYETVYGQNLPALEQLWLDALHQPVE